jgi:hypothetical protein
VLASELNDLDCNKVGVWFKTEFGLLFEKNILKILFLKI